MKFKPFLLILIISSVLFSSEEEVRNFWPDEIKFNHLEIVIYQPQLEHYDRITLSARSAISVKKDGKTYFGALWFKGKTNINKGEQLVEIRDIEIKDIRFIDDSVNELSEKTVLAFSDWTPIMSLQSIISDLDLLISEKEFSEKLKNDPPEIIFSSTPALLVVIDGEPLVKSVDESNLLYVLNTPHLIVTKDKHTYYLNISDNWYKSNEILTGWQNSISVPSDIKSLAKDVDQKNNKDDTSISEDIVPKIIVRTKPTELISTNGKPEFSTISGTNLLYLKNSSANVILNKLTMEYYLLISGRWFKSDKLGGGNWKFVAGDKLPEDFLKIPKESDIAEVRVSISGTEEANNAVLESQIPQTSMIDRKTKTTDVKYDGNPQWKLITSTNIAYAVNSNKTVLKIDGKYYCVDDGVWFVANHYNGPWDVAVVVPDEIYAIPPNEPVYHIRYVHIYDYTPTTVVVGYLPGYHGTYIYHGCVVYGTGYYYKPWHGHYFFPRPWTYGHRVYYHPYYGWVVYYTYPWYWYSYYPYHSHTHYYTYNKPVWKKKRPIHPFGRPIFKPKGKKIYKKKIIPFLHPLKKKGKVKPNNIFVDKKGSVYKKDNVWFKLKGAKWNKLKYNKKDTKTNVESGKKNGTLTIKDYFKSREKSNTQFKHFKKKIKKKK